MEFLPLFFQWIANNLISIIAVIISLLAYCKSTKKIAMLNDAKEMIKIIPAWYMDRMKTDYWAFGLLTQDGRTLVITNINSLSNDGKWIDVELAAKGDFTINENQNYVFAIAEDRKTASVQLTSIVAFVELITS